MKGVAVMKLTKEHIDRVRHMEGFPIASDEDIIALSDPPYYTACPNPFIEEFIEQNGKPYDEANDDYHREPFASDVSEGKNDPIYNAHSYHTKVPHKAIMRYILHYTEPGDIVFDGFCGTGMTGVAAQLCGNPDRAFKDQIEQEMPGVKWGARKAVLNDLSPAATFIAYNYNTPVDVEAFEAEANRILAECEKEYGWMYETLHTDENGNPITDVDGELIKGRINYVVWSDVFICPHCTKEFVFWDVAVDKESGIIREKFKCYNCNVEIKKNDCKHSSVEHYDKMLKKHLTFSKQIPVMLNYSVGKKRQTRNLIKYDMEIIKKIETMDITSWYPIIKLPNGFNTEQPKRSHGLINVHHFYTRRNIVLLSLLLEKSVKSDNKYALIFLLSSINIHINKMRRYQPVKPGGTPGLPGTLYISSNSVELSLFDVIPRKISDIRKSFFKYRLNKFVITTQSLSSVDNIPNNIADYIFTDPPFGKNLNYSELNFIWESWMKLITNNANEAIINNVQNKSLREYQLIMEKSFEECYRILKPGRWMTVEFHNSQNSVWNAIQEALIHSGFIVADVRMLDKKQGSFKQVSTTSAVKQDLVISAYKPKESFKRRFIEQSGTKEAVWDFVRQHLEMLPKVVESKSGKLEVIAERQAFLLFDRMVAFHVQNGISVPMDAGDFYKGLKERFMERDGMYFLSDQVNEYDEKRIRFDVDNTQVAIFVTDEKMAIQWLYHELRVPQLYRDLQPKFVRELHQNKYEQMPELINILEDNFLRDEEERWYIPDVNKASDLAKLRDKKLVNEFEEYTSGTGKLKKFRIEAVRAGFDHCWKRREFQTIVQVAKRLPESVVQEDPALLMYVDNASNMTDR